MTVKRRPDGYLGDRALDPSTLMMGYGYEPARSEGSLKCPVFLTSTFVFRTAEEGKDFFALAYGLRGPRVGEEPGLIYSRLNNPDLEILEDRLALWDDAEAAAQRLREATKELRPLPRPTTTVAAMFEERASKDAVAAEARAKPAKQ